MSQPPNTFDYLDENAWAAYFNTTVIPLAESADLLWECQNEALSIFRGHAVTDFENDESIKQILLGGVKSDRTLSERSLYKFYRSFIGLEYDHEKYITEMAAGVKPTDVTIEIMYTPLIQFARWVKEICKYLLNKIGKELPKEKGQLQNILKNPQLLLEEIKNFHELAVNFTAGYNPATYFVWSLRKNTRKHLNASYERLGSEELFAKTSSFLGLAELFKPDMADPSKYIVFGFPEYSGNYYVDSVSYKLSNFRQEDFNRFSEEAKSVGGLICYLNELIWAYLQRTKENQAGMMDVSMIIQNLPDAKKEYFDHLMSVLNEKTLLDVSRDSNNNFQGLSINQVSGRRSASIPSLALTEALDSISEHQSSGIIEYNLSTYDNGKSGTLRIGVRRR